jgi:hypothetical protein
VDIAKLVFGGVLGGLAGIGVGGFVGHRFDTAPCEDCIEGLLYGALVGEAVGAALGVHLANGRRGSALAEVGASLGITGIWYGLANASHPEFILAVPVAQIAAAVGLEAGATRGRE